MEDSYAIEPPKYYSERRRSSDIYLEPSTSDGSHRQTLLETDFGTEVSTKVNYLEGVDEPDKLIGKRKLFIKCYDCNHFFLNYDNNWLKKTIWCSSRNKKKMWNSDGSEVFNVIFAAELKKNLFCIFFMNKENKSKWYIKIIF